MLIEKKCKFCNILFKTNFNNRIFCSDKCKNKNCKIYPSPKIFSTKNCVICKKEFIPKRETTEICSRLCIDIAYNNKRPRKTEKRYHENVAKKKELLTQEQLDIINGTILGDGYLYKQTDGFHRLSLCHSDKQLDYLKFKMNKLSFIFRQSKPNRYLNKEKEYNGHKIKERIQYHAHSISHPSLTTIYNLCYRNKIKYIDRRFLNLLNETSLLIWFLDDGSLSKRNRNSILCTNCFTISEVKAIQKWFFQKFRIISKLRMSYRQLHGERKGYPILHFSVLETCKLFDIFRQSPIFNELPECMLYKVTIRDYVKQTKANN